MRRGRHAPGPASTARRQPRPALPRGRGSGAAAGGPRRRPSPWGLGLLPNPRGHSLRAGAYLCVCVCLLGDYTHCACTILVRCGPKHEGNMHTYHSGVCRINSRAGSFHVQDSRGSTRRVVVSVSAHEPGGRAHASGSTKVTTPPCSAIGDQLWCLRRPALKPNGHLVLTDSEAPLATRSVSHFSRPLGEPAKLLRRNL